ncbi:MAG: carboxypeptidase-like regulatory domain-containing protein, partial [Planctomycetota bacterium]
MRAPGTAAAYTDEDGRYRLECFGPGVHVAHVDARQEGFVRTRIEVELEQAGGPRQLDVTLRHGASIAGTFVNEQGEPVEDARMAVIALLVGAREQPRRRGGGPQNRHLPAGRGWVYVPLHEGSGDYPDAGVILLEGGWFLVPGMMPGKVVFRLLFARDGREIARIVHGGEEHSEDGLTLAAGQSLEGVEIVLSFPSRRDGTEPA